MTSSGWTKRGAVVAMAGLAALAAFLAAACGPDITCTDSQEILCDYQADGDRCMCVETCATGKSCASGYNCMEYKDNSQGLCVLLDWPEKGGPGESCHADSCASPLTCVNGTCRAP